MPDLTLERRFGAPPEKVFDYISRPDLVAKWWGPEGFTLPERDLAFDRTGPWVSVMQSPEGQRFKVSGHVTHVDPPKSVGFTWAWHDENDKRGVESHVTIRLVPDIGGGTRMTLNHVDLPEDSAASHEEGWTSTLSKLERLLEA